MWRAGPPWVNPARQAGPAPAPAALPVGAAASDALETLPEPGDSPPAALARAGPPPLTALPHALAALAAADWPADMRCYAAELHGAEARVAAGLVRLAAQASQLPAAHEERVRRWLSRNEKETGARLPSYSISESILGLWYMPGTHEKRVRRRLSANKKETSARLPCYCAVNPTSLACRRSVYCWLTCTDVGDQCAPAVPAHLEDVIWSMRKFSRG